MVAVTFPPTIKFKVSYYDAKHKGLLSGAKCFAEMEKAVKSGISIDTAEFQAYTVFRHHKNKKGWKTYKELKNRLPVFLPPFEEYFSYRISSGADTTIQSKFDDADDRDGSMTETAGIGAALALISKFYGLTEADWDKIPVTQDKDLDFTASTGTEIVEVEAKGTVDDGKLVTPTISNFKKDIEKKKVAQRAKSNSCRLIGVIASFPPPGGNFTHCRLLDPPAIPPTDDPVRLKLLSRLMYYWREFSIISSARFLVALVNRIQDVAISDNYLALDGVRLMDGDGDNIENPGTLYQTRSIYGSNQAVGEVIPMGKSLGWYFYGMDTIPLGFLLGSNFGELNAFQSTLPTTLNRHVSIDARVRTVDLETMGLPPEMGFNTADPNRRRVAASGFLSANSAGRVFGRVEIRKPG